MFLVVLVFSSILIFTSNTQEISVSASVRILPVSSLFAGGNGTESNPYQISNVTQLQSMNEDLDAHYILVNDINASETRTRNGGKGFLPIGNSTNYFEGSLDGKGFYISGLSINRQNESFIGLIGFSNGTAQITNISLRDVDITGYYLIGGIAGTNLGLIKNSSVTGRISGYYKIGGIAGSSGIHHSIIDFGTINKCNVNVIINGLDSCGGIAGMSNYGTIEKCSSSGQINDIENLIARAGGLIGSGSATVRSSFSTMEIYGNCVGGCIGDWDSGSISNCYSTGDVFCSMKSVGGFIGYFYNAQITNCYSTGKITSNYSGSGGGFIGSHHYGTVSNCYWDVETSGRTVSDGGLGMNTSNMMKESRYVGWDFENTWNIVEDGSYPFLRWCDHEIYGIITRIENDTALEDHSYQFNLQANTSLPGGKGAFWNITTNAGSWLEIEESGILSGTPTNDDVGEYWVNASATINNIDFDYLNFTLEVLNTNDPPVIETKGIPDATEDLLYSFTFEGSDIDPVNDELTWSMETNGEFLELDPVTGKISGLPTNNDIGSCTINIILDDGKGGSDEKEFRINVYNINDPPTILPFEIPEVLEDESFSLDLDAIDEDPTRDNMLWSISTEAGFIEIGPRSGIISGIPGNEDVGTWWIEVNVTDEKGGFDEVNFTLEVLNVNDDPFIELFDVPDAVEDIPYFLDLDAGDIDQDDVLKWTLKTNASFLSIDEETGNITGTPGNEDVGVWRLNVSVFDGNGGIDYKEFELEVLNVNDAPRSNFSQLEIEMLEDSTGFEKDLNTVFYDIDGDQLSFDHGTANNLSISIDRDILKIDPIENWSGSEVLRISAFDFTFSISINASILVTPTNDPPYDLKIFGESTYEEGENQILDCSARDVDIPYGDELTYTWSSNTTGEIGTGRSINLSLSSGKHLITLTVTDKEGLSNSTSMEIEVLSNAEERTEKEEAENGFMIPLIIILTVIIIIIAIAGGIILFFKLHKKKEKDKREAELSKFHRAPSIPGQYVKSDSPFMIQRSGSVSESFKDKDQPERLNPR